MTTPNKPTPEQLKQLQKAARPLPHKQQVLSYLEAIHKAREPKRFTGAAPTHFGALT